ncbi:LLM class flavin-dependent oxidoreductase [Leifsonia aquatica]|uniref:LLM class flavin-dependent oxidoreductase n=1 Tax=Leifsonia aquatica TaxID=144185 RepID=UPI0004A8195D|nr:LLM class flavin-dependent oxidoreductase [Leifsonia aquatica]
MSDQLIVAVALEGAGWHPAAWRDAGIAASTVFRPSYWVEQARRAEAAGADFLTFEDALSVATPTRPDRLRGRLDALQLANFVARRTERVGLVPTTSVLESEPFHASTQLATLDFTSEGRAGWKVQLGRPGESANIGRRSLPELGPALLDAPDGLDQLARLFDEGAEFVAVVRRLWDSWEDDAVIRDAATGRYLDRSKLHHVDVEGAAIRVAGPSITPRPPQGQPVISVLAHAEIPYRLAVRAADLVYITPVDAADAARIVDTVRTLEKTERFEPDPVRIVADLVVLLEPDAADARRRLARWDDQDGEPFASDAAVHATDPESLADRIAELADTGIDGVRLRPASVHRDLPAIGDLLIPALRRRGLVDERPRGGTLRDRPGLDRPRNRYAA